MDEHQWWSWIAKRIVPVLLGISIGGAAGSAFAWNQYQHLADKLELHEKIPGHPHLAYRVENIQSVVALEIAALRRELQEFRSDVNRRLERIEARQFP
jgi:hypothetical protein